MRRLYPVLLICFAVAANDAPADPSPVESTALRCELLLAEWSKRSSEVRTVYVEFERVRVDPRTKTEKRTEGSARAIFPGLARIDCLGEDAETLMLRADKDGSNPRLFIYSSDEKGPKDLPKGLTAGALIQNQLLPFFLLSDLPLARRQYRIDLDDKSESSIHLIFRRDSKNLLPTDHVSMTPEHVEVWLDAKSLLTEKVQVGRTSEPHTIYSLKGLWSNVEINAEDFVPKLIVERKKRG